jgi:hypothetical protein
LLLGVIAYNLGNLLRRLVLPVTVQDWSLTSLQQRLFKTGGRLIRHARYFTLQLAESYLTGPLFRQILARVERLAWYPNDRADGMAARRVNDQRECLYGLCSRGTWRRRRHNRDAGAMRMGGMTGRKVRNPR